MFFLLPLQTVLAVLIAVVVWLVRWKRSRECARQMVEDYNRRRSSRQVRLNPSKDPKKRGKLKHYSPTLMPLSLSKAVRTVAPQARETERRLPPLHIGLSATGRAGSGREKAPR